MVKVHRGWDSGEWDEARWDEFTGEAFTIVMAQLEKIPSPLREQGIMDSLPAILIDGDVDCRVNVYTLDFDRLKKQLEKV